MLDWQQQVRLEHFQGSCSVDPALTNHSSNFIACHVNMLQTIQKTLQIRTHFTPACDMPRGTASCQHTSALEQHYNAIQ